MERICTERRYMQRKHGSQVAKALMLRLSELRYAAEMADLWLGTGRWEELTGDRSGQWSARLSANWRLIVEPQAEDTAAVLVIEVADYHRR